MRVLIVGGGVAGISLTHILLDRKHEVTLFEAGKNVSSSVAAGMINPVVFRRMTLSWRVDEFLPFAEKFYQNLEQKVGAAFFHPLQIRRLFASQQEREFWEKKQFEPHYTPYLTPLTEEDIRFPMSENTFGTGRVKQCAYVEPSLFLSANYAYLKQKGVLHEHTFDYSQLNPETGTYGEDTFDLIVFAEGKDGKYNPYFSFLPLQLTKGEVLTLKSSEFYTEESLNRKCFLLPLGNDLFKAGSTYVWDTDNTIPTEEGRKLILDNLKSITAKTAEIIEHKAGVRPTVLDRRPLLGKHPVYPKLAIANGLGAKGYLLAPLVMTELADHLLEGTPLNPETLITRFPIPTAE